MTMSDNYTEKSYAGLSYWEARKAIQAAAQAKRDTDLKALELLYPEIFKQMVQQASNAMGKHPRK